MFKKDESQQHCKAYDEYLEVFSTAISIDACAGGDFLKWEAVLDKPLVDVYTFLQYKYAKQTAEDAELEYQRKKQERGAK